MGALHNLLLLCATAGPPTPRDTDQDGLPDALELQLGSDPLDPDSDGDGVPDGVEDRDHDGQVDPGESDPRIPGLFPGTFPYIPEPLSFDLVRGLGARKGEIEVNNLMEIRTDPDEVLVEWAPEVEWAFAEGHAVELELPLENTELVAVKLALQSTFPPGGRRWVHGWQTIGEVGLSGVWGEISWLYLLAGRFSRRVSGLMIVGPRFDVHDGDPLEVFGLVNPSLFVDVTEAVTLGFETNLGVGKGALEVDLLPQFHAQLSEHVRLQLGVGASRSDGGRWGALISFRAILE